MSDTEVRIAPHSPILMGSPMISNNSTSNMVDMSNDESEEDREAMKELAKIMKMKNASDWQEMALNLGRLKARMDVGKRTNDMEELEKEIDVHTLPMELEKGCRDLRGIFVEFLLTLSDIVLNSEDSHVKLDEKSEKILVKAVDNLFKILRRVCAICKAWIKPRAQVKRIANISSKKTGDIWKVNVECVENKITFTKKVKLESSLGAKQAIDKILEKIPVKHNDNHGLYIASEHTWIEEDKCLQDFPLLSNGKTVLQLRVKEMAGGKQRESMDGMLDQILLSISSSSNTGQVQKNVTKVLADANNSAAGNFASIKAQLESNLQERIFSESNAIRILAIQIISSLQLLQKLAKEDRDFTGVLQIIATCRQVSSI